jgi:hypothetical protein
MNSGKVVKAVIEGVSYLAVFIAIPLWISRSEQLKDMVDPAMLETTVFLGIALAFLHVTMTLTSKGNIFNLLASVFTDFIGFYIFLYFIGFGSPLSFGIAKQYLPIGEGTSITVDFRIFAWMLLVALLVKVVGRVVEYLYFKTKLKENLNA